MNIRLLNHDDVDIFRALRIEAVHESPGAFAESIAAVTKKSSTDFADHLDGHGRGDFVVGAFDEENHLVGMVGLYRAAHAKKSHKGTLWGMYVTPARRQEGIGSALVAAAIEHARNLPGLSHITLCVTAANDAARRLYASKGFQVYGIEQEALNMDGVYLDEVLMELSLTRAPIQGMRRRRSARLLVIDQNRRVLLFRFFHKTGVLAGKDFWATPGGAMEEAETFAQAACRELFEETGIVAESIDQPIARKEFILQMPDGEQVIAQEQFFVVRASSEDISKTNWTVEENKVIAEHRWWSMTELISTQAVVFPEDIVSILKNMDVSENGTQP